MSFLFLFDDTILRKDQASFVGWYHQNYYNNLGRKENILVKTQGAKQKGNRDNKWSMK